MKPVNKPQFTPGPWVKMNAGDVFEDKAGCRLIASCFEECNTGEMEYAEAKANALLIAAAPDMYELLETIREVAMNPDYREQMTQEQQHDLMDAIYRAVTKCLAKARGGVEHK